MCGRYVLPEDEALPAFGPFPGGCCVCAFRPRYNVPPTAQVPIVVSAPAGRQLRSARFHGGRQSADLDGLVDLTRNGS